MNNQRNIIFFSNLIINKYIVKKDEINKFKDILQSYYAKHKNKFDDFTVCVMWKKNDVLINKISVPSKITIQKPHLFKPTLIEVPIVERVPPFDFPDTFDRNCINDEVVGINIIFISYLEDIKFSHYMTQPKSMLCRKLGRISIEEDFRAFDYNWLPNCFRHIHS